MWICAIDFKKAFDTVEHESIWAALEHQKVHSKYISILKELYTGQTGQVIADKVSRNFDINRGTKQGDPISPCLFSAVLEFAMGDIQVLWKSRRCGIELKEGERLTNLRFADDILLFATSREMLSEVLRGLKSAAGRVGLELHMGKTKILTNEFARPSFEQDWAIVDEEMVEILHAKSCTMYLGRCLNLHNAQENEIEYRIGAAWGKFISRKSELCSKNYSLRARLKLFEATVTKTALYGSETWAMTAATRRRLSTTQRKMLRWMVGSGRKTGHVEDNEEVESSRKSSANTSSSEHSEPSADSGEEDGDGTEKLENWVDWIKRTTGLALGELQKMKVEEWVSQQRRLHGRWAGHVLRMVDNRWTVRAMLWEPTTGSRRAGRPSKRWIDDIWAFCTELEDSRRMTHMLRNAGKVTSQYRLKWQRLWKRHEDGFARAISG